MTLELALQTAFRQNPQLRIAELEVEANKGAVQQAGIIPNPSLGFEQQDTGRATRQTTFQLSQPIELGGKRSARMELANSGQEVAMAELAMRRAELRAVTTQAFFEALIAQERVRVAEESLKIVASGTAATARRVTAGKISPTEETRARVAEANVRIELRQAQADRLAALRSLALVMGSPANSIDQLDGRPETLPIPQGNEAINDRLMKSPVLRRAQGEVRRAQAAYELERARRIPDVTVSLGAVRSQDFGRDQPIIGLSIPLPLFDRNQGAQLQALRRLDAAQVQAEAEEVRLRSEVLQAADQLQARTSEVQALQQEVLPGAQSAYEAASRGFELGKFGFLDVLDAQRTWLLARTQYLNALGEAHRASAELERRLGSANDRPELGNQP
ncbi:MAG: TolC family protein [Hylemonella sp.]|uniref:TolC family protein n=1 Tax=Hylemonella sp. TaxID=2066020 RepID=UPI00391BE3AB